MTECEECEAEMTTDHYSCDSDWIQVGLVYYPRVKDYFDNNEFCHDCGIENKRGNIHHFGCDIERCPVCKGQLISCECADGEYSEGKNPINSENHLADNRADGCRCEICNDSWADQADNLVDQAQEQGVPVGFGV